MTIIAELMTYVNDLRQIGALSTNKTYLHYTTEILLKVAFNTIAPSKQQYTTGTSL